MALDQWINRNPMEIQTMIKLPTALTLLLLLASTAYAQDPFALLQRNQEQYQLRNLQSTLDDIQAQQNLYQQQLDRLPRNCTTQRIGNSIYTHCW